MKARAQNALLEVLNAAAGALLDLDPDGKQKLAAMEGRVFCLEVTVPPVKLFLSPTAHGVAFDFASEREPDVTLTGSAFAFARLARGGGGKVTVTGDAELGQALQKILAQLDLDWEELLSRYVGDTPARKFGVAARTAAGFAKDSFDLACENAGDYLREERKILATQPSVERFEKNLHQTRADVDRLTRRVERIQRVVEQHD